MAAKKIALAINLMVPVPESLLIEAAENVLTELYDETGSKLSITPAELAALDEFRGLFEAAMRRFFDKHGASVMYDLVDEPAESFGSGWKTLKQLLKSKIDAAKKATKERDKKKSARDVLKSLALSERDYDRVTRLLDEHQIGWSDLA